MPCTTSRRTAVVMAVCCAICCCCCFDTVAAVEASPTASSYEDGDEMAPEEAARVDMVEDFDLLTPEQLLVRWLCACLCMCVCVGVCVVARWPTVVVTRCCRFGWLLGWLWQEYDDKEDGTTLLEKLQLFQSSDIPSIVVAVKLVGLNPAEQSSNGGLALDKQMLRKHLIAFRKQLHRIRSVHPDPATGSHDLFVQRRFSFLVSYASPCVPHSTYTYPCQCAWRSPCLCVPCRRSFRATSRAVNALIRREVVVNKRHLVSAVALDAVWLLCCAVLCCAVVASNPSLFPVFLCYVALRAKLPLLVLSRSVHSTLRPNAAWLLQVDAEALEKILAGDHRSSALPYTLYVVNPSGAMVSPPAQPHADGGAAVAANHSGGTFGEDDLSSPRPTPALPAYWYRSVRARHDTYMCRIRYNSSDMIPCVMCPVWSVCACVLYVLCVVCCVYLSLFGGALGTTSRSISRTTGVQHPRGNPSSIAWRGLMWQPVPRVGDHGHQVCRRRRLHQPSHD